MKRLLLRRLRAKNKAVSLASCSSCIYPLEQGVFQEEGYAKIPLLILAGPTGCGKTGLSLFLSEILNGEIVSADSMQVYRGMDIGTAKATPADRLRVPHHLIDIRAVHDPITVFEYESAARAAILQIVGRRKLPIVVGGAGFYLRSLIYGPPKGPPADDEVRAQLRDDTEVMGLKAMYDRLEELDPLYAKTLSPSDRQKVLRALEIIEKTGGRVSDLPWGRETPLPEFRYFCWFIHRPRDHLYARIEQRCENMLRAGLCEEVERLIGQGLCDNRQAAAAIGYRQCLDFLRSDRAKSDYDFLKKEFFMQSRRYAKRQFTWFRREPMFRWLDVDLHDIETAAEMIGRHYFISQGE